MTITKLNPLMVMLHQVTAPEEGVCHVVCDNFPGQALCGASTDVCRNHGYCGQPLCKRCKELFDDWDTCPVCGLTAQQHKK